MMGSIILYRCSPNIDYVHADRVAGNQQRVVAYAYKTAGYIQIVFVRIPIDLCCVCGMCSVYAKLRCARIYVSPN